MTLLLSRSDLERLLDVGDCLAGLRRGFLAEPSPIAAQRVRTDLPGPGDAARTGRAAHLGPAHRVRHRSRPG